MNWRKFKFCAVFVVVLALLHSGVAWALQTCRHGDDHVHQSSGRAHENSAPGSVHSNSSHSTVLFFDCVSPVDVVGRVAAVSSHQRFASSVKLPIPGSTQFVREEASKSTLFLLALFKRSAVPVLSSDSARYLFLSTLQI